LLADGHDSTLVEGARRGDDAAFALLIARHWPLLIAICRRMLRDDTLAEDAAQEAILRASSQLDRLRDAERFGPWLAGIGVNVCRDLARGKHLGESSWDGLAEVRGWADQEIDLAASVEAADLAAQVREAVEALPNGQRRAVQLFYLAGLTYAETATQLGIQVGTVRTRLHKARETLRHRLQALGKEEGMTEKREFKDHICSFCGKHSHQIRRMIAGPKGVIICNECVDLCNRIIAEEEAKDAQGDAATAGEVS